MCWGVFFFFCFVFERWHVLAWKSMLMYLFIYLFGCLPVPNFHWLLPEDFIVMFWFFCFGFFFPLLTWGPFGEGCDACWDEGALGQLL